MAIYYKFKSSKDYSFVPIAGLHISVADLKQCIVQAKCLGGTDYDLLITNAQTNEDYNDEKTLIHRNTSVILRRIPGLPRQQIVVPQDHSSRSANVDAKVNAVSKPGCKTKIADVFTWAKIGIPPEVLCPLCQIIMKDAVLPRKCCFQSFCHKCIRENIISKNTCACGATNLLIEDLVPNYALRKVIMCISESSSRGSSSGTSEESLHLQNSESARSVISEEPLLKGPSNTLGEITPVANVDQRKIASIKPGKTKACSSKSDPLMSVYNSTTSAMSWDTGCMTGGHMPSLFYTPKSFGDSLAGAYWQVPYWSHAYMMDAPIPSETLKCGESSKGTNVVATPSLKEKLVCPRSPITTTVHKLHALPHLFCIECFELHAAYLVFGVFGCLKYDGLFADRNLEVGIYFQYTCQTVGTLVPFLLCRDEKAVAPFLQNREYLGEHTTVSSKDLPASVLQIR